MTDEFNDTRQKRLREAEQAETEVTQLQPLAEQAPMLRLEKAKLEKHHERQQTKITAMSKARAAAQDAKVKQGKVHDLLAYAAVAVGELCALLIDIDKHRKDAAEALAKADRVDYDIELEEVEETESSLGRDTSGLAYTLAARHGDQVVKEMLEELDPGFDLLRGCNLDDPLNRDVGALVVKLASSEYVPSSTASVEPSTSPATAPPEA